MTRFLVDTWFFVAYVHREDPDHHRVQAMWRLKVAQAVRNVALDGVEVVPQDRKLFLKALALYEQRLDKKYSLADCMSMVLMRERGIQDVLTNDHHFRQEG